MNYKMIKILILFIPTLTIGVWEFVRHEYLLPYISMELGNWLAPILVFLVSITLLLKLFGKMEELQQQLLKEQAAKTVLQEREIIAQELHDGIAQSLFLLSVKVDRIKNTDNNENSTLYTSLRMTAQQINEYVRQAICSLRQPPQSETLVWQSSIQHLAELFEDESGQRVRIDWNIRDEDLSTKEKVELYSSIREGLQNIRKHADAELISIEGEHIPGGWKVLITDDGKGFTGQPLEYPERFGLKIMKERAERLGWLMKLSREGQQTILCIEKREDVAYAAHSNSNRG
ncbi:two-component system, NarL family, nitrate/nitrite sensor histidine kinase NarQ [Paenibacillus uliginis N3/975]|uniref:histidine kinase n=1 Tax=Paenibacillus uliginis N3/975 TaxID=1313296 RepID=A0A1X7GA18_9BACL|nr:histidine kinase [Paenibacillus uliginis]SMF66091.1 two-component system, NarL family, nitrate/nitrite sensor histidine kinase NarQ [Paenibacillus uliginis N3/975]